MRKKLLQMSVLLSKHNFNNISYFKKTRLGAVFEAIMSH